MNRRCTLFATLVLLMATGCEGILQSRPLASNQADAGPVPPLGFPGSGGISDAGGAADAGIRPRTITQIITTADASLLLSRQVETPAFTREDPRLPTIDLDLSASYQEMDGFGFTLTEGSAELIRAMSPTAQAALMTELFDPEGGIGLSVVRVSVGASDLSSSTYSYLSSTADGGVAFSLEGPDLTYLVPVLHAALKVNPSLKIIATPWTAPLEWKTNGQWKGGHLKSENYPDYAQYFADYLSAMRALGIPFWGITPQNEPKNGDNNPSMLMTAAEQTTFIKDHLAPRLRAAGFSPRIIAYDHNADDVDYPTYVTRQCNEVDGAAFHLYAGAIKALDAFHRATGKNVYFTEQYTAANGSFSGDLAWHLENVILGAPNHWAKVVLEWNLANAPDLGPHTPGGCNNCLGALTLPGIPFKGMSLISSLATWPNTSVQALGAWVLPVAIRSSSAPLTSKVTRLGVARCWWSSTRARPCTRSIFAVTENWRRSPSLPARWPRTPGLEPWSLASEAVTGSAQPPVFAPVIM